MDLAGYVINAVLVEGRSVKEVCEAHDISRSWLYELMARYREQGEEGLNPQSKAPHRSPTRVPTAVEEEIVALRKELTDLGVDAGAHTIHYHLQRRYRRRRTAVPSVATIWRVLSRRGFVTPQPQKRPKSSWRRFQAELPNECWQADTTHWTLADGTDVEILNVIDDHSRLLVASRAFRTAKAADVVETFHLGASELGVPASMLTDNGAIFTAQGKAISDGAAGDVRVLVVGNPANTNALIAMNNAPGVPAERFTAMTRLDHNRAKAQLATKAGAGVADVTRMTIWGNHSATQYPDVFHAEVAGKPAFDAIGGDQAWLEGDFIASVQQRGAAIIRPRGQSSAASAANAVIDTVRNIARPTGAQFSAAIPAPASGGYGVPEGLVFGYPLRATDGGVEIVQGIEHGPFAQGKIDATTTELLEERAAVEELLA